MAVTIRNKMNRPVMIRLNSGRTCYLNAGDTSGEIIDVEIAHNKKLIRLQDRNIVELQEIKKPVAPAVKIKKATQKVTKNKKANP
jgi:hypothetical protein